MEYGLKMKELFNHYPQLILVSDKEFRSLRTATKENSAFEKAYAKL